MKKKITDFLTRIKIWFLWDVRIHYNETLRCADVRFTLRRSDKVRRHSQSISEGEYLYDTSAAILRVYRDHVIPSEWGLKWAANLAEKKKNEPVEAEFSEEELKKVEKWK